MGQLPAVVAPGGQDRMKRASHPSLAELDMAQLIILGLCTIMTLLSVVIHVEEVLYLTRKIRCPIKMKTLCWSSSAPTVSWAVRVLGGITLGARATQGVPALRRGQCQCAKLACPPGCVCGQLLRPVVPALHDGGGDGDHGVSVTHPGTGHHGTHRASPAFLLLPRYFAVCFYLLMMVMVEGFGGKEALLSTLKDVSMVISTGPCCCCCPCLPRITMSR